MACLGYSVLQLRHRRSRRPELLLFDHPSCALRSEPVHRCHHDAQRKGIRRARNDEAQTEHVKGITHEQYVASMQAAHQRRNPTIY